MNRLPDRRAFLRAAAGTLAAPVAVLACGPDGEEVARKEVAREPSEDGARAEDTETVLRRPVVRRGARGAVWIDTPVRERPVAYVSMASRRVYVDREYRDRASWLLDAHISVSTWVWRIPLPGDSPLTPIPPGDERREFEELPMADWNPATEPAEGDVRIVLGRPASTVVEAGCVPIQGTSDRLAAGRLELERCSSGAREPVREDFGVVGYGRRHADRTCGDEGVEVSILAWSCNG